MADIELEGQESKILWTFCTLSIFLKMHTMHILDIIIWIYILRLNILHIMHTAVTVSVLHILDRNIRYLFFLFTTHDFAYFAYLFWLQSKRGFPAAAWICCRVAIKGEDQLTCVWLTDSTCAPHRYTIDNIDPFYGWMRRITILRETAM
jgi:hypothetical protein